MNHARRQQYRRVSRAGRLALTSVPAAILGLYLLAAGAAVPGAALLVLAIMLGLRHGTGCPWPRAAGSEPALRMRSSALDPLRRQGWEVRRSVSRPGGGDLDSVVIAPGGVAFAIETKTRAHDERHLRRVREQAVWLARAGGCVRRCRFGASSARPASSAPRAGAGRLDRPARRRPAGGWHEARCCLTRLAGFAAPYATSEKLETASSRASVSARLVGASAEASSTSAMARDSQLIAS